MSASEANIARAQAFAPVRHEGAVELIVRRIGEAIGSGVLGPGERLPTEIEFAQMLEVSPMTLRAAIVVLREAGFVQTRRGRTGGSFVVDDPLRALRPALRARSAADLWDLTVWRRAVSGEIAAQAAGQATVEGREELAAAARAVDEAITCFPDFRLADSRFHLALAEVAGNGRLIAAEAAIQAELRDLLAMLPAPVVATRLSAAGHLPIVAAVAVGDPCAARVAMERHVESTHDWIAGYRLGLD